MPAIRADSASVVSMPPREKRLAKRRARAVKRGLGLPPSIAAQSPNKQVQKRVLPTLATTRERRARANCAYLVRPDGIHIKRVVRRLSPGPIPPVPYLPGQEDIPHSDDESNGFNHAIANTPDTTQHYVSGNSLNIADEADDLLDYDAEGEEDDEYAHGNMDMDIDDFSVRGSWDCPSNGSWDRPLPNEPVDLLANASEDDIQALFSGLDSLRFDKASTSFNETGYFSGDFGDFGDFGAFEPPAPHMWSNVNRGPKGGSQVSSAQEPSTAYQVDATTGLHGAPNPLEIPSPLAVDSALPHSPLPPLRHIPTPAPWVMTPEVEFPNPLQPQSIILVLRYQPTPLPPVHQAKLWTSTSRAGTPLGRPNSSGRPLVFSCPRPRTSTSGRASQIRSEAEPLGLRSLPLSPSLASLASPASSANLTPFLTEPDSQDDSSDSDSDAPRASTPVEWGDTDIGRTASSVLLPTLTQAQCRAAQWLNFKTPRPSPQSIGQQPPIVPALLELRANAREHFAVIARKTRVRDPNPTAQPSNGRGLLRSWELTPDQSVVMGPMEYHVYKDLVCVNPWPQDRDAFLEDARDYAVQMTGVDGAQVFTRRFMDTVYSRMSANRGETLAKIEAMVQQELSITVVDKREINMYIDKNNFLYPTIDRDENQKFRVHIIGSALLIILFECGKQLARVFMEELNRPDDPRKCADWHRKVRDRTARSKGIPPGLIAYAATQIHWALLKLQRGGTVQFHELQFRAVWAQYLRALLKLKHLGGLRMDLLELVQKRYVEYWPGAERDDDDDDDEDSCPAW